MTRQRYNKTEATNRILRSLEGKELPTDAPETLTGDILSVDEALSDIAELMAGSLPGEGGLIPAGIAVPPAKLSDSKNFYVIPDHANASDANTGENPAFPLATVNQAVTNSRAYHGDVIWVTSSSSWQYGAMTETGVVESLVIPPTKPGIAIVGVSRGSEGCYWQPTGSAGWCIWCQALDVTIDGFCFWSAPGTCNGIYLDWNGPTAYGENTIICNNTFTDDCDYGIQMEYTWYVDIFNNRFQQCNTAGIMVSPSGSGVQYVRVYDNWFNDCTNYAMLLGECEYSLIRSNHVFNTEAQMSGTFAGLGIHTASGSHNLVEDNYLSCHVGTLGVFCKASPSDAWINNHCMDGEPVLIPGI